MGIEAVSPIQYVDTLNRGSSDPKRNNPLSPAGERVSAEIFTGQDPFYKQLLNAFYRILPKGLRDFFKETEPVKNSSLLAPTSSGQSNGKPDSLAHQMYTRTPNGRPAILENPQEQTGKVLSTAV